ncbi:hypothetical protein ASF17_09795 [Frigoribacterium sp. Leaf263]|nr:hypothetical protein ASF17_09795 [Frigoribacterium sp. Leaf263]
MSTESRASAPCSGAAAVVDGAGTGDVEAEAEAEGDEVGVADGAAESVVVHPASTAMTDTDRTAAAVIPQGLLMIRP